MSADLPESETTIEATTIERMVQFVEPDWQVRSVTPAERGFCAVYRVAVETPAGDRVSYLKASPDGEDWGIPGDARITALLDRHTDIPVPTIIGVVDEHRDLPAPYYVMEALPGEDIAYEAVGRVGDAFLRTTAQQLGRHLGALHRIPGVESFGHVTAATGNPLSGEPPAGRIEEVAIENGADTWPAYIEQRLDYELDRLEDSERFADLEPAVAAWARDEIAALDGPFAPVLGRNDHGFHNLLVDRETGGITGMLDWAYTLAVTPAFDFELAVFLFGGGFMAGVPEISDRSELVRAAMLEGYRSTAPTLAESVSAPIPLYELFGLLRICNDVEQLVPRLPDGTDSAVEAHLRSEVRALVDAR